MGIQEEYEVLQLSLNKVTQLVTEVQDKTAHLSNCSCSEMSRFLPSILELCHEGKNNLRESLEQIERIQILFGHQTGNHTQKTDGLVEIDKPIDKPDEFFKLINETSKEINNFIHDSVKKAKGVQAIAMLPTILSGVTGLLGNTMMAISNISDKSVSVIESVEKYTKIADKLTDIPLKSGIKNEGLENVHTLSNNIHEHFKNSKEGIEEKRKEIEKHTGYNHEDAKKWQEAEDKKRKRLKREDEAAQRARIEQDKTPDRMYD
jgi:hypothetical protein